MSSNKVIGIDLGTTNSCVAVLQDDRPILIPNLAGERLTPSVVRYHKSGEVTVGSRALAAATLDPENTIRGIKRLIGCRYSEIFDLAQLSPYPISVGDDDLPEILCHGRHYTPQEVSARMLAYLKKSAERFLKTQVDKAVITVPAYFGHTQRQATKEAAEIAGIEVMRIVNEPTAAAMAYGFVREQHDTRKQYDLRIVVFDLGGGTLDISILEYAKYYDSWVYQVISTAGDNFLGGDDFDSLLYEWIVGELKYRCNISIDDPCLEEMARDAARDAKHQLAEFRHVDLKLKQLTGQRHFVAARGG